jgi:hypothetical protein
MHRPNSCPIAHSFVVMLATYANMNKFGATHCFSIQNKEVYLEFLCCFERFEL